MPVSKNKRKDGRRHKPKRRYLTTRELIGATLLGRQLAKEAAEAAKGHKHDHSVSTIDVVQAALGTTEEHADEQRESEGQTPTEPTS